MLIASIVSLIISLLLQGLTTNFTNYTLNSLTIFQTIYVLINLIVIERYFESEKKYFILLIIFGLLMDITYSNTLILNVCIFIAIHYINKILISIFPYNIMITNVLSILSLIIYHITTFLFLIILGFDNYNILILLKVIASSIIMTIIYTTVLYYIFSIIYNKSDKKLVKDKY